MGNQESYIKTLIIIGILLLAFNRPVLAESDSNFCISKGYVAWELGKWSATEQQHVLKIARVGGSDGISDPITLQLDDFQVHGMKCEPTQIVILSWQKKYLIDLASQKQVSIKTVTDISDKEVSKTKSAHGTELGRVAKGYEPDVFIYSRESRSLSIPSDHPNHIYELSIAHQERNETTPGQGGTIYHDVITKIIEKNADGSILKEKSIYKGTREETID